MMKILLSVCCILILGSCATNVKDNFYTREKMLPNGNWELNLYSIRSCADILADQSKVSEGSKKEPETNIFNKSLSDIIHPKKTEEDPEFYNKCVDLFKQSMAPRSKALCSNGSYELYGCVQVREESLDQYYSDGQWVLGCYLKCK